MRSPIPDYLLEVLEDCANLTTGAVADYIPELAQADPDRFGICLATVDGVVYSAGDTDVEFSIQSMSKPFTYGLAIADNGLRGVLDKVGVEPSGEAFNEISLESETGRPKNPMINAGAITAHSLVSGAGMAERVARIRDFYSACAGRELGFDTAVFESELATGHRNLGMGYLLRSFSILESDPSDVVEGYIRQCAIGVDCRDLALMAATLANGGVQPTTGKRVLEPSVVRQVLSVMATCGMYDAAGDWLSVVGIPAKSGVAGGIIGVLPGQVGVAVFSPRLDEHGNSVRGVRVCERLSADMGMHLMDVAPSGRAAIRSVRTLGDGDTAVQVYELQGDLRFAAAENIVRSLADGPLAADRVAFDLHLVHSVDDVARRMLLEAVRRLTLEGRRVALVDPEELIPDPDAGGDVYPEVVDHVDRLAPTN